MTRRTWDTAAHVIRSTTHRATWIGFTVETVTDLADTPAGPLRSTREATQHLAIRDYRDVDAWRWRHTAADTWTLEVKWT